MDVIIREMNDNDADMVLAIYAEGIATGYASFQENAGNFADWDKNHMKKCRIVAVVDDIAVGWAALSAVSNRCVFNGIGEASIYIADSARGMGIGKKLLTALIEESEKDGIWSLHSGIFKENIASIKLHQKLGFRNIGFYEKMGKMTFGKNAGKWLDVVMMERRSKVIAID